MREPLAPFGVVMDGAGNLYISDGSSNVVRKVNAIGITSTVAGNGTRGYSGDGGAATGAQLYYPDGVALDSAGNLYIADSSNDVIRAVNLSSGVLSFAITDAGSTSSDSPKSLVLANNGNAELTFPSGDLSFSSANFALNTSATTCPVMADSYTTTMAAGDSCTLAVDFTPAATASGALSGSLAVTDNSPIPTQTIGLSGTANSSLTASVAIASESLSTGAGANFTPVTASGGTAPLSYSVNPALPSELSISSSSGAITGTPAAAIAAAIYTVTVTDANHATAQANFLLTVSAPVSAYSLSASSLTFGSTVVGATALPQSVTLT
ncbi:MAG: putative Ig domain-containing protein, partial [Terracidiphilus sp.]